MLSFFFFLIFDDFLQYNPENNWEFKIELREGGLNYSP